MRLLLILTTLLLNCCMATSQVQSQANTYETLTDLTKKKDQSLLYQVREDIGMQHYPAAVTGLTLLLERHPNNVDLLYMRGAIQNDLKNYDEASEDLKKGLRMAPEYRVGVYLELGKIRQSANDLAGAKTYFQQFLNRIGPNDPAYEKAKDLLKRAEVAEMLVANPVEFTAEPLSEVINTEAHDEYFPNLSVDGQRLIFVRNLYHNEEDFFESIRQEDGSWSVPRPLEYVNTEFNEGAQTVSADGNLIVYTICGKPGGLGGCDLYFTERKAGRWSPVSNLGPAINGRWKDTHPSLSADGKLLFFASTRPGGLGKFDIWGSARNEAGDWSPAINMGKTINTKGEDAFPFFHADGKTLYFTSDGHPGMGGSDLFLVRLLDNNTWTEPQNLGYPINTAEEETNIFISLDGQTAFFAKQKNLADKKSNVDIYTFVLPETARPIPATYLRATVIDADSRQPLEATVRLRALDETAAPKNYRTEENGSFLVVLPAGKNYALSVDLPGYVPYSAQFSLDEGYAPEQPFEVSVELKPATENTLVKDEAIVLRNVLFATGSADLLPVSYPELDRLYELLTRLPELRIEIGGHTDNVGSEDDNLALSEARARAVRQYLLERGVPPGRLEFRGYGESKPIADNATSAGRAENRRTEFIVL